MKHLLLITALFSQSFLSAFPDPESANPESGKNPKSLKTLALKVVLDNREKLKIGIARNAISVGHVMYESKVETDIIAYADLVFELELEEEMDWAATEVAKGLEKIKLNALYGKPGAVMEWAAKINDINNLPSQIQSKIWNPRK